MKVTIEDIKRKLTHQLPGEAAHIAMSPSGRRVSSEARKKAVHYKESAVALVLYEQNDDLEVILTKRTPYRGAHSGEVCFPGGKMEEFETDLTQTAIRECVEEIGLLEQNLNLLGELTPVYIPVSNYNVHPYVFYYTRPPLFIPDKREVADIFTFPVDILLNDEIIKTTTIEFSERASLKNVPYFDINNEIVWGATALILHEFKHLVKRY